MRFLYWNLGGKQLLDEVTVLAHEHQVDVLVLSECRISRRSLLLRLNAGRVRKFAFPYSPLEDPLILIRLQSWRLRPVADSPGLCFRTLVPPLGPDILLVAAHLPSKLYQSEDDQALFATRVSRRIGTEEAKLGHSRTVLLGDLNMSPYEYGVVGAEGLHAVMSRHIAERGSRVVGGEDRPFFYNPMWGHFGDSPPSPPGTYYYASSKQVCFFWYMFDQVMIRPDLLEYFDEKTLQILDRTGETSLLTVSGTPNGNRFSDHLPVVFSLDLAKGASA